MKENENITEIPRSEFNENDPKAGVLYDEGSFYNKYMYFYAIGDEVNNIAIISFEKSGGVTTLALIVEGLYEDKRTIKILRMIDIYEELSKKRCESSSIERIIDMIAANYFQ